MFENNYTFIINENLVNYRLDKAIANLSALSRSKLQMIIVNKGLQINGQTIEDADYKLKLNDKIEFYYSPNVIATEIKPLKIELDIVFEDEYLLVINKPANLTVHPGAGNHDDTLVNALVHHFGKHLSNIGGAMRPGIVHRLDKDTSGLMLIAKDDITHAALAEQIALRNVKRHYQALIWGLPKPPAGTIITNIGRAREDRTKMAVVRTGGKQAITHYKIIEVMHNGHLSLVSCKLETGRTHQIRVHMNHIGHSIVGDQTYGHNKRKISKYFSEAQINILTDFRRQALHSAYINFIHPITQKNIEYFCNLPVDMQNLINNL